MTRWLPLVALLLATPAAADEARPYIFTQVHNGMTQQVAAGTPVQVQLPAGPAIWQVDPATTGAELTGDGLYPSPGRIPGTDSIQVFDFRLAPGTGASIVITSDNPPPILEAIVPAGHFSVKLMPME